jgi:hypothetical protein
VILIYHKSNVQNMPVWHMAVSCFE